MVAGRQGGVPMIVGPCDIPAKKESVEITLTNEYGTELTPDFSKNGGLNPVTINGVEGVVSSINGKYYFTRSQSGYETLYISLHLFRQELWVSEIMILLYSL